MTKTILIIEDSPSLARTYQGFLKYAGYDADTAETAGEAESKLAQTTPDLVLLDLQLPDGDGMDILQSLQARA